MSKTAKTLLITGGILVLLVLIIGGTFVSGYNRLINFEESINSSWAQVENVLQRRNDLIPNLVNTVTGYAGHEKEIFEKIADARAKLAGAKTINEKVKANSMMGSALGRLIAVAESNPQLKASGNFQSLQDELAGTENRIAVERRRYNEVVRAYNVTVRRFPTNIIAALMGFEKKEVYFEAEEGAEEVPEVKFD